MYCFSSLYISFIFCEMGMCTWTSLWKRGGFVLQIVQCFNSDGVKRYKNVVSLSKECIRTWSGWKRLLSRLHISDFTLYIVTDNLKGPHPYLGPSILQSQGHVFPSVTLYLQHKGNSNCAKYWCQNELYFLRSQSYSWCVNTNHYYWYIEITVYSACTYLLTWLTAII